jgi:hypothetical protein
LKPEKEDQSKKSYQPYETKPAEQMQYDWTEYTVLIGGSLVKVYVHLSILGYSRHKVWNGSLSIRQSDVFEALEEGFQDRGGVCERLQVDNAKVFVDSASRENFKWNRRFLDFCGFYGIKPTRSLPYHPWSKGKVEKPFSYLEDHFIQGNSFESFEEFLSKLKIFAKETNSMVHGVTKKTPEELFVLEGKVLLPLPAEPITGEKKRYIGYKEEFRKVTSDCLISYGGNRYSVPHYFVRSEVWVRVSKGIFLHIYSQKNARIAVHKLSVGKGEVIINQEHYKGYRKQTDRTTFDLSAKRLRERFSSCYARLEEFILSAKAQKRISPSYNMYKIVGLFDHYHDDDCVKAMQNCFYYNCFTANFVQGYITHNAEKKVEIVQRLLLDEFRMPKLPPVKRDLKEYKL